MNERTLQGSLTFLGFAISIMAVFYFGVTYLRDVSEYTRLGAMVLLGLCFAFLGVYLKGTTIGQPFFDGPRLAWLRPPVVMYLSALFCGIVAEIVFLNIDGLATPIKILVSLAVGIGLIVAVAQRAKKHASPPT